jgi:predicted alpha-1,6-mannanase (GH76 family)
MNENKGEKHRHRMASVAAIAILLIATIVLCLIWIMTDRAASERKEENMMKETESSVVVESDKRDDSAAERTADKITNDIAKESLDIYLNSFYVKDEKGGYIVGEDFWQQAEIFEIIIDAYEQTGDQKYLQVIEDIYQGFISNHGEDWSYNEFNDDIMWMTIACARTYAITKDVNYLQQAEKHFNLVFDRAWSEDLGGGLFWRIENKTKNSCINCPAVIAACLLGELTDNKDYMDKALMIYKWEKDNLFGETGAVFDAYDLEKGINNWCSTYNQGTFIGAAMKLYQYTGDEAYLQDAKLAADYTVNTMFSNQVMNTEGDGNDLPGFKGILARWLGKLIRECDQEQYVEWFNKNAVTSWNNRNSKGIMWTLLNQKTEDTFHSAWGCSSAVSVLINCPKENEQ